MKLIFPLLQYITFLSLVYYHLLLTSAGGGYKICLERNDPQEGKNEEVSGYNVGCVFSIRHYRLR